LIKSSGQLEYLYERVNLCPEQENFDILTIFPNPVIQKLNFSTNIVIDAKTSFNIFHSDGRLVYSVPFTEQFGSYSFNIPDFPTGVYMLEVRSETQRLTQKFIKNKL